MPDLGVYCPLHEGYAYSGREITGGNSCVWAGAFTLEEMEHG